MRNHLPHSSVLLLAGLLALTACGGGGGSAPGGRGGGGGGGGGGASQLGAATAKAAAIGGHEGRQTAATMAALAVDGVRAASALGAGGTELRTYGTLVQDQAGQFTYQPMPADRLRAHLNTGKELEFFVATIAGDVAGGGVEFLRGNHDLAFRVVSPGLFDLQIAHTEQARQGQGSIRGTMVIEDATFELDLRLAGTSQYEASYGSLHYELDERITGLIRGGEVTATVDDSTHLVIVGDNRHLSSQSWRKFAGKWQVGGVEWELRDGLVNRAFRDGKPHELETTWQAQGTLLRAGQPVGAVRGGLRNFAIRAWLEPGDGREVELEAHQIR